MKSHVVALNRGQFQCAQQLTWLKCHVRVEFGWVAVLVFLRYLSTKLTLPSFPVSNKWIREGAQLFARPCKLTRHWSCLKTSLTFHFVAFKQSSKMLLASLTYLKFEIPSILCLRYNKVLNKVETRCIFLFWNNLMCYLNSKDSD